MSRSASPATARAAVTTHLTARQKLATRLAVSGQYVYRSALRPLLFRLDPEQAHGLALRLLALVQRTPGLCSLLRWLFLAPAPELVVSLGGLTFPNPVGVAAGLDKNGLAPAALTALGFGHVEVGTVTPAPQAGNPRPRLFRLPEDRALINRLGFPNDGVEAVARRLRSVRLAPARLGLNIGKGRETPLERAAEDYLLLLERLFDRADYVVLNVSSPNTPDLRQLQARQWLDPLLQALQARNRALAAARGRPPRPLFLKIAPDLTPADLEAIVAAALAHDLNGLIATNTTVRRPWLQSPARRETGGLSGHPLRETATALVRRLYRLTEGRLPIIGVGGILSPEDALERIRAGASLVQVYTGLVYEGPFLGWLIAQGIRAHLHRTGLPHVADLVGQDV